MEVSHQMWVGRWVPPPARATETETPTVTPTVTPTTSATRTRTVTPTRTPTAAVTVGPAARRIYLPLASKR